MSIISLMRKLFIPLLAIVFMCSCVPGKDLIYLQGKPVSKKEIHRMNNIPYKLQVNDIIIVDVKAADSKLVALFNKDQGQEGVQTGQNAGGYFNGFYG